MDKIADALSKYVKKNGSGKLIKYLNKRTYNPPIKTGVKHRGVSSDVEGLRYYYGVGGALGKADKLKAFRREAVLSHKYGANDIGLNKTIENRKLALKFSRNNK